VDLGVGADAIAGLRVAAAVHIDASGHQRALRLLAGVEESAGDEQRVEAELFGVVRHAELIQSSRSFPSKLFPPMTDSDLNFRIKKMMVESLMLRMEPEEIGDDVPLFSPEGLGLDSIDALELAVGLEKNFGAATPSAEVARQAFQSVNSVAEFIRQNGRV